MHHSGQTCAFCDRLLEAYTDSIARERRAMLANPDDSNPEVEDHWKMAVSNRRDRREVFRHMVGHGNDVEDTLVRNETAEVSRAGNSRQQIPLA
jgi:hypothetical protein